MPPQPEARNRPVGAKSPAPSATPAPGASASAGRAQSGGAPPLVLSNTSEPLNQLVRRTTAILLENARLDTALPLDLPIPQSLRARGDAATYIVQCRGVVSTSFRGLLRQAGAATVAYIPNNTYLVRASASAAQALSRSPGIQAVLPYEPYYKLKAPLLALALNQASGEGQTSTGPLVLKVLLFNHARGEALSELKQASVDILAEESSTFGPVLTARAPAQSLARLAGLPSVQEIEPAARRVTANDLSRVTLGVAVDATTPASYLGLTGNGVVVNVNDTGVDTNQPDLAGRVSFDAPLSGTDTNGHGTHVAGIIAGSGIESPTVTEAPGSIMPPASLQFRGQAPAAGIFSVAADLANGPRGTDSGLQQTAAQTNVFISNNSWLYAGDRSYDLAAASYDAAVRDALPAAPGAQPLLFVFAAGNDGAGTDNGTGGNPDSILSPATAKNVITVGAVEHPRFITNQTWTCAGGGGSNCQTNTPWLGLTDASNQVASFSSRGNVGVGIEGGFGRFKPDVVAPGTFIVSSRSTAWNQEAYYAQSNNLFIPEPDANAAEVLSNLNNGLGPFYRFESGTSLAAANASGVLALMQEFFQQRLGRTNSPALMKALLINGARSLAGTPGFQIQAATNSQGWGLIHLPNSIPGSLTNLGGPANSSFVFDQDPARSLTTGQGHTCLVSLSPAAQPQPLRVTLVWTDPPGNPVAGLKLVNNLDLIVTNLDTGAVFYGNDFAPGAEFTSAWNTNAAPNADFVNNVENVYLAPRTSAHYSVTVFGRQINVDAVGWDAPDTAQDYALVISSGDGQVPDALTVTESPTAGTATPAVTVITNTFPAGATDFGNILLAQRIGAGAPFANTNTVPLPGSANGVLTIGSTNQWQFYAFTNETAFTNAAFITFLAKRLSFIPGATNVPSPADIDLYVSTNPALTSLDPNALAAADRSAGRGGTETIAYSNAVAGVYYLGVKCESQEGAEYGFAAVASQTPFAQADAVGNQLLEGFPAPALVPGGSSNQPGRAYIFGMATAAMPVRRVIVTNTVDSASFADLQGTLSHGGAAVVLNNFATNGATLDQSFIYDDSGEGDVPGGQPSDGPGSLQGFAGHEAFGQWRLTVADTNQPATNDSLEVFLEQQQDLSAGEVASIAPGACRQDYVLVPLITTNLTVMVSFASGTGPLTMQVCPRDDPSGACLTMPLTAIGTNGVISVDSTSHPPLNPGMYVVRVCNLGPDEAQVNIFATHTDDGSPPPATQYTADLDAPIPDAAVSRSTIQVTNLDQLLSVEVGVRIDHPHVSDLALSLIGPDGARVLLDENRGGDSTAGLGCESAVTNTIPVSYVGGPEAVTNVIDTGETSGVISISYNFFALPDTMHVYYDGQLLFDSGLASGPGSTNLAYGPGLSSSFTIVMNEGGNADSNTAWFYTVTTARMEPVFLTFTEDTNLASTLIKFAPTPLTNVNYFGSTYEPNNGIFYLPEESLGQFAGQSAAGPWTLEIADRRADATNSRPMLWEWQLSLRLRESIPMPLPLPPALPATNLIGPGQIQWFAIDAPEWVGWATNRLVSASAPINLLYNQSAPPTGTNAGDFTLLANSTNGVQSLATNGIPPLVPGARYYLGVQNTNNATVGVVLEVDFDIGSMVTLLSGQPYAATNAGPANAIDYYRFVVPTNAMRAQFEINGPSAGMLLAVRQGLPLPNAASFDYLSANVGTNDQLIVVYDFSRPVPLTPGEWFLAAVNTSGSPAGYSILATDYLEYGTNILITDEAVTSSNACLTWTSLVGAHYYLEGKDNFEDPNWVILSPTLTAGDVATTYCLDLPSPFAFFRVQEGLVISPPPLILSLAEAPPRGLLLQWIAFTNAQFTVRWSPSLTPPAWTSFTNRITSTNADFFFLDDGSQTGGLDHARYYQVRQLP